MGQNALAARGRLGAVSRRHPDDQSLIDEARRDLALAKIEDYVGCILAASPPFSAAQRARLRDILRDTP